MKLQLDWSAYENAGMGDAYADIPKQGGDFAKAVAVCIGSRQCERPAKGVMCPSFRVSGNPLLSPGGRVKLLKAALNAADDQALFNSELSQAMDLCVSCKGCKRECENEVDMALIKAEYLAQRRRQHGLPLRSRLFGHIPKLLRLPFAAKLITLRNRQPWLAKLGSRWLGIAAAAPLPTPVAAPAAITEQTTVTQSDEVVLFIDTFTRHFHPQAGQAAQQLLQAAGYRVHAAVADGESTPLCCGRTYFANGMLSEARREAERTLIALQPHIQAGRWIIGLEPSCILSLRDEYLKLGLGEIAQKLAERSLLLEEFIGREQTAGRWKLAFTSGNSQPLLIHGHCHQKAVGAMKAMRKVLKSVAGLEFEFIETSCCGMAGHFGLEQEHYQLSQDMAEQALFPALRAVPQAAVIANGFSCRLQISNAGFAPPQHIAELLYATISTDREPA